MLEILAVFMVISSNTDKQLFVYNTVNRFLGRVLSVGLRADNYVHLIEENDSLVTLNQQLMEQIINCHSSNTPDQYSLIKGKVVRNTISRRNNIILIAAGKKDGVEEGMGVISKNGNIIGKIISVSRNYSAAISILNEIISISAKHGNTGLVGTIVWDGKDPQYVMFEDIRMHSPIKYGDTIYTSGYSQTFPEGLKIGVVDRIDQTPNYKSYIITVRLLERMQRLDYVYIIANKDKYEIDNLYNRTKLILGE
jgi:rod shape-determining protein MreC